MLCLVSSPPRSMNAPSQISQEPKPPASGILIISLARLCEIPSSRYLDDKQAQPLYDLSSWHIPTAGSTTCILATGQSERRSPCRLHAINCLYTPKKQYCGSTPQGIFRRRKLMLCSDQQTRTRSVPEPNTRALVVLTRDTAAGNAYCTSAVAGCARIQY